MEIKKLFNNAWEKLLCEKIAAKLPRVKLPNLFVKLSLNAENTGPTVKVKIYRKAGVIINIK